MRKDKLDTDCVDGFNHSIVAYHTIDFITWSPLGTVFAPQFANFPEAVLYRPHVLYSTQLDRFVMWYKIYNRGRTGPKHWYGVAVAKKVSGPYEVLVDTVTNLWTGDHGAESDMFLFKDDDGSAYLVRYHAVQRLNGTLTGVEPPHALLPRPASWETPIMFKQGSRYFIIGGHNCCACRGGSNAFVMTAEGSPLGNWTFVGDIGRNISDAGDKHSPYKWTTHAQTSAVFTVREFGAGNDTIVMLSNQWVSAPPPEHARNQDLLYWNRLRFNETTGMPEPIQWSDQLILNVSNAHAFSTASTTV